MAPSFDLKFLLTDNDCGLRYQSPDGTQDGCILVYFRRIAGSTSGGVSAVIVKVVAIIYYWVVSPPL